MNSFRKRIKLTIDQFHYALNISKKELFKEICKVLSWNIFFYERYYFVRKELKDKYKFQSNDEIVIIEISEKNIDMIQLLISPKDFQRFKNNLHHAENCFCLQYNGKIACFVFWSKKPPLHLKGPYKLLEREVIGSGLYTIHQFRGMGLAEYLLNYVFNYLQERNYKYFCSIILKNNEKVKHLLRKLKNFEIIGESIYQRILGIERRRLLLYKENKPL